MKIIYLFCIAIFLMAGCQPSKSHPDTPVTSIVAEPNITTMTPSSVPIPVLTSSQTSIPESTQSCPKKVVKESSLADIATGTIVSQEILTSSPTFLDIQTNQKYEAPTIPETVNLEKSISPDRKLLATIDFSRDNYDVNYLRILNARGEVLEEVKFDIPDLHKVRWLDNKNLLLYTYLTPRDGTVLLFNPFTRRQIFVSNEIPNFYDQSELSPFDPLWLIEYSPNLEWGVYMASNDSGGITMSASPGFYLGPVVYDFSRHQPIWIPVDPIVPYLPKWSLDGNQVMLDSNNQIYIVTREGNVTLLLDETNPNHVFGSLWSPDGNNIAFWNNDSLMYYNLLNDTMYDLCFTPGADRVFPFVWSPDSRFIFTPAYAGENSTLIDIQDNIIYSVTASLEIHYPEWMISIP